MSTDTARKEIPHEERQSTADQIDSKIALKRNDGDSFITIAAEFAMKSLALYPGFRAHDGRFTFAVSRWAQSSPFTDWNEVMAFLAQMGGSHGR